MNTIRTIAAIACFLVCIVTLGYAAAGMAGLPVPPVHCLDNYGAMAGSVVAWFAIMITGMCLAADPS